MSEFIENRTVVGVRRNVIRIGVNNRIVQAEKIKIVPLKNGNYSVRAVRASQYLNQWRECDTVHLSPNAEVVIVTNALEGNPRFPDVERAEIWMGPVSEAYEFCRKG